MGPASLLYPGGVLNSIDHALFVLLAVLFPIWAAVFGTRRLKRAAPEDLSRVRLSTYRRAMAIQWTLSAAVLGLWVANSRGFAGLGLVPRLNPALAGVLVGMVIVAIVLVRQRTAALADDDALARLLSRLGKLELMLPHGREELTWWYRLSVTAGICEELLYRGYLIWYLSHWLGLIPAAGVAAAVFGVGHSYQGARGMLLTGVAGLFFGAVYLLTGSLFASMLMHALMDIHSGHLAYVAFSRHPTLTAEASQPAGPYEFARSAEPYESAGSAEPYRSDRLAVPEAPEDSNPRDPIV